LRKKGRLEASSEERPPKITQLETSERANWQLQKRSFQLSSHEVALIETRSTVGLYYDANHRGASASEPLGQMSRDNAAAFDGLVNLSARFGRIDKDLLLGSCGIDSEFVGDQISFLCVITYIAYFAM
jgi:hypothetical protein